MDDQRFDNLTRLLGSGVNRRKVLRGLLGGAGALAATGATRQFAGAQICDARVSCENVQQEQGCPDLCPEGSFPGSERGLSGVCCNGNGQCCSNNCVNGVCDGAVPPECEGDGDCGACQECEGGECVDLSNCCTSDADCGGCQECEGGLCVDLTCGPCETCGNHTCTPIEDCCASDDDCGACQECEGGFCVDLSECCESDADCGSCEFCDSGTCHGACSQSQECCEGECVDLGECCRGTHEPCGLLVSAADGSPQFDCCDGLVCCENLTSQHPVCAECCNDWDCPKGAVCHEGWCKFPDVECDHDKDCAKGTCCCKDGSCSGKCCDHHPHKPEKPVPAAPVTSLPATGAGPSDEKNGLLGAAALGAAAAVLAAKKMRETPGEAPQE